MSPECADLPSYADGELEPSRLPSFETHLLGCADCQRDLADLLQLAALGEEAAARRRGLARLLPFRRPPVAVMALAASLLLSVATGAALWRGWGGGGGGELWLANAPSRLLEARVSRPEADRFRPYDVVRAPSAPVPTPPLTALGALERRGDKRGIAVAYLVRRQPAQAEPYLDGEDASAEAQVDRSAAALLEDDPVGALERADRALGARPDYAPALWNRALALKGMGLLGTAAEAFDQVAALNEPGWSQEARDRARALREELDQREKAWNALRQECRRVAAEGVPLADPHIRAVPGQARACFFEAVRTAPSRERVQALLPMAGTLDDLAGDHTATGYARWAAARDFARRAPLAKEYGALAAGGVPPAEVEALLGRLRASGERDLLLGALAHLPALGDHLEELVQLSAGTSDPWFQLLAQERQANAEMERDRGALAVDRLERALERCQAGRDDFRCLTMEWTLSFAYVTLQQYVPARDHALRALARARRDGEWLQEQGALLELGQIARLEHDLPRARAYLEEALLRAHDNCAQVGWIATNLATAYLDDFQVPKARRRLDPGPRCRPPADLAYIALLADLARRDPRPDDGPRMAEALAAFRARQDVGPGERAMAKESEGRSEIERDRARGQALLREAIAEAAKLPETETHAQKARAYAYSSLLMDAGKHGELERAMAMFAEELGMPPPEACALGVNAEDERTLVVARGPNGAVSGRYDGGRRAPLTTAEGLVTPELRKALAGCAAVQVLARPLVVGLADLLPPDVAWSYRVSRGAPAAALAPAAMRRLLVTSAIPPVSLHLAPLSAPAPAGDGWTVLRGEAATPGRVLEAMRDATEVQIHAHGLVNPERSDSSFIALSPDAGGEFALTAGDLGRAHLSGRPLVVLAACYSARTALAMHQSQGLAAAFIRAGARTVLAATQEIPDGEAPRFFDAVLERIRKGQPAAVALRDERVRWTARGGGRWVEQVLLFE